MQDEFKPKSFWERPEGTTGMFAIGAAVIGLYFAGGALMNLFATAITLVGQAITLSVLGAILFGFIMIVTNSKFQTLVSYGFKSVMRKITGAFVEIDPIGIMKSYIEDLKGKRDIMNEAIGKLSGQIQLCKKQVDQNDIDYERSMSMAKVAKDQANTSVFTVQSRQAGRLEKLNKESLRPLLMQMEMHQKLLKKYHEVTGTVIDDLGNEVKSQQMQRDMMKASYGAMSAAKRILNGGTDQRELFDQAMEYTVNDYGMKMGEIENFIENSRPFVEGLDIQNGVYEAEAMAKFEAWGNKADSILLGNSKQQILEQTISISPLNVSVPAAGDDYSRFLNKSEK